MRNIHRRVPLLDALEARTLLSTLAVETEPNNRARQADAFAFDADNAARLQGVARGKDDRDFFAFTAPASGPIRAVVSARNGVFAALEIEDGAGRNVLETEPNNGRNAASGVVQAGVRYFVRLRSKTNLPASYAADLTLGGTPVAPAPPITPASTVVESRGDDRAAGANGVTLAADQVVRLQGAVTKRDRDFYRFVAPATGTVALEGRTTNGVLPKVEVETAASVDVFETEPNDGRSSGRFALTAGQIYFVRVRSALNATSAYEVDLLFSATGSTGGGGTGGTGSGGTGSGGTGGTGGTGGSVGTFAEVESNDEKSAATPASLAAGSATILTGTSTGQDDRDFFRFTAATAGRLTVSVAATAGVLPDVEIEDSSSNKVLELEDGATVGGANLVAGRTYFVRVRAPKRLAATYRVTLAFA